MLLIQLQVYGLKYLISHLVKGFSISVGPTFGHKNQINASLLNIVYNATSQTYRKEILDFKQEESFYFGYRLSFGYDFYVSNKLLGLIADFNNNTYGNVNLFVGASVGIKL